MHELPMVMDLLSMMDRKAKENKLSRITEIDMKIGELSDLVDECIEMYFETASEGTVCEGARLVFEREPAMLRCPKCGKVFPHEKSFDCPSCHTPSILVKGTGSGYVIERIKGI